MPYDGVHEPPALDNQYETDRVLQSYLQRHLPTPIQKTVETELTDMGRLAAGELRTLQQKDRGTAPNLQRWDAWDNRVDDVETTDVWDRAAERAAERGVVASAYEQEHGRFSRLQQMALAYLFIPSAGSYGQALSMTDGAACTLRNADQGVLTEEAVSHLTSRDPETAWTATEWMTEHRPDTSPDLLTASRDANDAWRLDGQKAAVQNGTANLALTWARRADNEHKTLFYVPLRGGEDLQGDLRDGIRIERVRDTAGQAPLPTVDLTLDGALAYPVSSPLADTQPDQTMRTVTRAWTAIQATASIRRSVALTRTYAQEREAYGENLINHPLQQETLADAQSTLEGAFHLSFRLAELMGRTETNEADATDRALLRLLAPVAKLTTARQAVTTTNEMMETFGATGYMEDTGLPVLLRDAQALPIQGGSTNEQALALIRTLRDVGSFVPFKEEVERCVEAISAPTLVEAVRPAVRGIRDGAHWLKDALDDGEEALQAGARRFAMTLGKSLEVLYTARHAQWSLQEEQDGRSAAAAERLAARQTNRIADLDPHGAYVLVWDFNCPTLFDCHAAGDGAEEEPVLSGGFADVM